MQLKELEILSPDLNIVSRALKACSPVSGLVWVGPVQTLAWASSTVWLGFSSLWLLYDEETDGFRVSASESPSSSISAEASAVALTVSVGIRRIRRPWSFTGEPIHTEVLERVMLRRPEKWTGEAEHRENWVWRRAFMAILELVSQRRGLSGSSRAAQEEAA